MLAILAWVSTLPFFMIVAVWLYSVVRLAGWPRKVARGEVR